MPKKNVCNPKTKKKTRCLSDNNIIKVKDIWNKNNVEKIFFNDPKSIISELFNLNVQCMDEICLVNNIVKDLHDKGELMEEFAPIAPDTWKTNIHTWLNTNDIKNVLNQYQDVYPEFEFIGPSPSDWFYKQTENCVCKKLCNLDLDEQLENGRPKIGVVFNLDPHDKPGSHWVSVFIDAENKAFSHFDSQGFRISPAIKKLYYAIKERNPECTFSSNFNIIHQKKNTECGIYCIYFILHMLKNNDFSFFCNKKRLITDKRMNNTRRKYFNIN